MNQYQQINLEDYIQSGEGGQALTYTRKDGSALAKMFLYGLGSETVEREFRISKAVYDAWYDAVYIPAITEIPDDEEEDGGDDQSGNDTNGNDDENAGG